MQSIVRPCATYGLVRPSSGVGYGNVWRPFVLLLAGTLASILSGCQAMAPGMHFDSGQIPASQVSPQTPIIKPITPQLVREERLQREKQTAANLTALKSASRPYTIDSGDVLSIVVWDHPELTGGQNTLSGATG